MVVIVLAILLYAMTVILARLNAAYDELTGRPRREARLAWLHSMNTQGSEAAGPGVAISALERIVMASVYLAVLTFVVWFFFLACSPLPG